MDEARLWFGGRVFTGLRYEEALLVENGVVVAVGNEAHVRRSAPTGAEVVDLAGRLVLPGLIDAHLHVSDLARFRDGLDVGGVTGLVELQEELRRWAAAHPTGPIVGRGLDVDRSLGGRWPSRADLDAAVTDRPLLLVHWSSHAGVANSLMLDSAELDRRSAAEREGRVGVDADGRPNGVLYEEALRWPSAARPETVDPPTLARTLEYLASFGITTVATMAVPPEEVPVYRTLAEEGRLPIRVRAYVRLPRAAEVPSNQIGPVGVRDEFSVVGTKGFADGAFGPRTAWLSEPYADGPPTSGIPVGDDASLTSDLAAAESRGLASAIHAIGDRGILRAARLLRPYAGRTGARLRIEHAALTPPEVLGALEEVRPALVVQPGFVWSDWWLRDRLGRDRARWAYAFRTLQNLGHLLVGSSDAPADPVDPWRGLRAATARVDELGRSANPNPAEALGYEESVQLYTRNAGRVFGEPSIGTLEPGSRADLIVLDSRTLADAVRRGAPGVQETWRDGVRRFRAVAESRAVSG